MLLNKINWDQVLTRVPRNYLDYRKCKFTHCFHARNCILLLKKKKKKAPILTWQHIYS